MRKELALLLTMAMAASLMTGCGSSADKGSETPAAAAPETSQTEMADTTASQPEEPKEMVSIDVWHSMEGSNGKAMSALIEEFNATRGKELGITAVDCFQGSDCAVKLKTLIQTNDKENMPDVCQIYNASLPVLAATDYTVCIDDMWGQGSNLVSREDLLGSALECYTYEGKELSMPFNASTILLFHNLDAYAEAGLTEADIPKTWDEVVDVARKLKKVENGKVERYGLNLRMFRYEVIDMISAQGENGTQFADNNNGRDGLVSKITCEDELLKVYQIWEKLIAEQGTVNDSGDSQNQGFATGVNVMLLRSSAGITAIGELAGDMNWCVSKLPVMDEGDKGGAAIAGASLGMFDKGDEAKKMAAWEFIMYTVSPEVQAKWSMDTGYLPVNIHSEELPDYKAYIEKTPALAVALEQNAEALPTTQEPVLNMASEIGTIIQTAATDMSDGKLDAQGATKQVVEACELAFEQYNRGNQ